MAAPAWLAPSLIWSPVFFRLWSAWSTFRFTCWLSTVTWVLPWASRSAWTGFVSRLQPASGTIRAPTQKAAMIGRARVFMIRLLSGKKRGEAGWSVDSGRLPFREGPRKAVSRRCCVFDSRELFPVLPAHRATGLRLEVLCRFCARHFHFLAL